jgi:hypothetical protein
MELIRFGKLLAKSTVVLLVVIALVDSYPLQTQTSDEPEVKEQTLQEDLDQFFLDQEHLASIKANGSESGSSGISWPPQLPLDTLFNQFITFQQLLEQYGLTSFDPTQMGTIFISLPMDWISQFINSGREVNVTRPLVLLEDSIN